MLRRGSTTLACLACAAAFQLAPGLLAPGAARAQEREEAPSATSMAASVELHGGFFGLFNLNKQYTDADPSFGLTAAFELDVHRYFALGAEYDLTWVKSVRGARHRLTMAPQARARFHVALGEGLSFYLIAAVGFAIWPEDDTEPELHVALRATRLGVSLRISGGCEYAIDGTFSIFLGLGYAATSTYDETLSAWIDSMVLSLGSSARF